MRDKKRPYAERTFASTRTMSVRKSAGSKRPRNANSGAASVGSYNYPMNLSAASNFLDIDTLFDYGAYMRARDGRPQLKQMYHQ